MEVIGDKISLTFEYTDGGLVLKNPSGIDNFFIAGKDKKFVKADVNIDEEHLIVSSPEVKEPFAVRYGWSNIVQGTLFNKAGLPASSFRTDDWDK